MVKTSKMEVEDLQEVGEASGSSSIHSTAWRGDPTLTLDTVNRSMWARIAPDRRTVSYSGGGKHPEDYGSVRATRPCASGSFMCYFEATIAECSDHNSDFSIGFVTERFNLDLRLGSTEGSFGMNIARLGRYQRESRHREAVDHTFPCSEFAKGDTFGCGVNFETRSMFFTRNGLLKGSSMFSGNVCGKLYPAMSLHNNKDVLKANFGSEPFRFDTRAFQKEHETTRAEAVDAIDLKDDALVPQLVQRFLLSNGYHDTLQAFAKETKVDDDENDKNWETLLVRAEIRKAILAGDIDRAIREIRGVSSGTLLKLPNLMYPLHCQQFIELVRNRRITDAVVFMRTTLSQYNRSQIQDVVALLSHSDPSQSLAAHLLTDEHKAKVAELVNSLVLSYFSINPVSPLSTILRHMKAVDTTLREENDGLGVPLSLEI